MKLRHYIGWDTVLAAASAVVMLCAAHGAAAAVGSVVASKHDFSTTGPSLTYKSATETQVCVFCHAPHNAASSSVLWNRANNTATYTLYMNTTGFNSLNATPVQPGPVSKLCLSCHDGTVAVDSFGGATGTPLTKKITGSANLGGGAGGGTNLADDHPIGFIYNTALATSDGGLKDPSVATVTIGTSAAGTIAAKMLRNGGELECTSCHDVHNSSTGTSVESKLLRISTAGSALCIACHNK